MARKEQQLEQLQAYEARAIIEDLRKGSVPVEYVPFFTVGRGQWLKYAEEDLDQYIAAGGAKVRFINGDYGDGKTHFMSVVRHLALEKGFAVSYVVLTREVPVHKFEVVYQEIARQLSGAFAGRGVRALVEHWLEGLKKELGGAGGEEKLAELGEQLRAIEGMDFNVANALAGLAALRYRPLAQGEDEASRQEGRETLYQWLEGARISKRVLKPFQIFEALDKTNSKRFLGALVAFLRHVGHKGLVLLMDELETVMAQSASIRNASYENVRLLMDNAEQASYMQIFLSIIPDVVLSEKGFRSYDALWSRMRSIGEGKRLNYRSVVVDLHRTPLEDKELVELGLALCRIHEQAYRWEVGDGVGKEWIEKLCAAQKRMGLLSEVRLFIKQVIRTLDMAEQGQPPDEGVDLSEQLADAQRELEQEKSEQLQPKWDR